MTPTTTALIATAIIIYLVIAIFVFKRDRKMGSAVTGIVVAICWFVLPLMELLYKIVEYSDRHDEVLKPVDPVDPVDPVEQSKFNTKSKTIFDT